MVQIIVGIGQHQYCSEDGGRTWSIGLREVPRKATPVLTGKVDIIRLPSRPGESYWDFVTLLPCGFGVAVDHEKIDRETLANVFVTADAGLHWEKREAKPHLPLLRRPSWPVERFASLAVPSPEVIALAWEDPWLFEWPESHVICSWDQGKSWKYCHLGQSIAWLAVDFEGRLLSLGDSYYVQSRDDGRTWEKSPFELEWSEDYDGRRVALLREVTFTATAIGYALVVHWPTDSIPETSPNVGLVTTADNGMRWRHVQVFQGPNIGDVNERHILSLRVT